MMGLVHNKGWSSESRYYHCYSNNCSSAAVDTIAKGAEHSPGYREVTQPFLQSKDAIVWILNDPYTSKGLEHGVVILGEDGTFQRQGLVGGLGVTENRPLEVEYSPAPSPPFHSSARSCLFLPAPPPKLFHHHDALPKSNNREPE
jgi:hypothetical protein